MPQMPPSRVGAARPVVRPAANREATAVVVAPDETGDLYVPALAGHGWNSLALTLPLTDTDTAHRGTGGYLQHVSHTSSVRHTAAQLAHLDVRAVVAGSPAGTELADRLAHRLGLPGNSPSTIAVRHDVGRTSRALISAGITAPRSIRTGRLAEALSWAGFCRLPEVVLQHPDPACPHERYLCRGRTDIRDAWSKLRSSGGDGPLVLREHVAGTQYRVHTLTAPGPAGTVTHTVTAIWAETRDADQRVRGADLLNRQGLLARALSLYMKRALTTLGVRYGPAHATLALIPDRGPALLALRTDPHADFASAVLRRITGVDHIRDTTLLLATGGHTRQIQPHRAHISKIALRPRADGVLDPSLLRTITTLPTVAASTPLEARAPVKAHQIAGWILLVAGDYRSISQDYQSIRAIENIGLYTGHP